MKRFVSLILFVFSLVSCATVSGEIRVRTSVEHVYIEPVTNRTTEESLDLIFSRVANDVFYSDPRFKVDLKPRPTVTLVVKPVVVSLSTFAVGFDEEDKVTRYRMSIKTVIKLIRYGFRKPLYVFTIERYDFYSTVGTASEIEQRRRECIERIAEQIFREVGERILQSERKVAVAGVT